MRNYFIIILLLVSAASLAQMQNVDAVQFNQLTKGEGVILDVRTPGEYQRGHIENSTLISIADRQFVNKINLLQKDKPVYIYCLTGSRSRTAGNYMAQMGFKKVYNLQRGILDWHRNQFPIVISEKVTASAAKTYSTSSFNELIQSENLVLIDFHAPWCAPCKKMSPIIDQLKNEYKGKVKVEKIDVESNRTIAEANQIESIPGFVLFKNGQRVWTHKGMITHADLSKLLNNNL